MAAVLFTRPKFSATGADGQPLAGGLVYTYAAGTLTPLATYTDYTGETLNTNPVVLDASGRASIWFSEGVAYRIRVTDADGVLTPDGDVDNILPGAGGGGTSISYAQSRLETQTLAAGATTVTFSELTYSPGTRSLFLFADGLLLTKDTDYTETNESSVTLVRSLPEGTQLVAVGGRLVSSGLAADLVGYEDPDGTSFDVQEVLDRGVARRDALAPLHIIAHRGFRTQGPENTLLAFSAALARGARGLECDVRVSSDGVLYCFHDATVDATTSGTGTFSALTASYLDGLTHDTMAGSSITSVGLCRFSSFLRLAREAGVWIYPEIKGYRTAADIELMVDAVVDAGMADRCVFLSFATSDLTAARTYSTRPTLALVGSSTTTATWQGYINYLQGLGRSMLAYDYTALLSTPAIVDYAFARNVRISAYTVPNQDIARQLMRIGVNEVMCDVSINMEASR